jgi:alkanesulfonate monooxygenase SsuD/methylene tetrahydromethanopterin reductase-like flavin-dependent oxidoreductase (luciferase family)
MKFGVFFPHQLPRPWGPSSEAELFLGALDMVEIADRVGVGYAWAQEHHFLEEYSHSTAPEVFLGACSQRTKHIRLGHGVSIMPPPVNHPARVAERIATLDLVSNGRAEWGTGEMSSHIELGAFNINYPDKRPMWAEAVREAALMMNLEPYPGHVGRYFSMPARNVVPKPIQRPHPPLWIACTNRETLRLAARLGAGALTFAFMGPAEAKYWVDEYYETFRRECDPIGQSVNPNIATLIGFYCDRDPDRHLEAAYNQRFFKYGLAHYYRFGRHAPGATNLWQEFERSPQEPMAGLDGVGTPEQLVSKFREYEACGVDQLILLQQAGRMPTDQICRSLQLFGREVIGEFVERDSRIAASKARDLAPFVERAMQRRTSPAPAATPPLVEAYPALWEGQAGLSHEASPSRAIEAPSLWNLQVGSGRRG